MCHHRNFHCSLPLLGVFGNLCTIERLLLPVIIGGILEYVLLSRQHEYPLQGFWLLTLLQEGPWDSVPLFWQHMDACQYMDFGCSVIVGSSFRVCAIIWAACMRQHKDFVLFVILGNIFGYVPIQEFVCFTPLLGIIWNLLYYLGDMWMCHHRDFVIFAIVWSIWKSVSLFG